LEDLRAFGKLFILSLMVCTWRLMSGLKVTEADLEVLSYVLALLAIPRAGGALGFGGRAIYIRSKSTDSLFCLHRVQKYSKLTALTLSFYQRAFQPSQC
jgi:hypothetical protein